MKLIGGLWGGIDSSNNIVELARDYAASPDSEAFKDDYITFKVVFKNGSYAIVEIDSVEETITIVKPVDQAGNDVSEDVEEDVNPEDEMRVEDDEHLSEFMEFIDSIAGASVRVDFDFMSVGHTDFCRTEVYQGASTTLVIYVCY